MSSTCGTICIDDRRTAGLFFFGAYGNTVASLENAKLFEYNALSFDDCMAEGKDFLFF